MGALARLTAVLATALLGLVVGLDLRANSTGAPAGRTGAPPEGGLTCSASGCHFGSAVNSGGGSLVIGAPSEYTGSETLSLSIVVAQDGAQRIGFQVSAVDESGNHTGTFTLTDANTKFASNNSSYVTHSSAPFGFSQRTFSVDWIAPPSPSGPVRFFATANAANGNLSSTGDQIYATQLEVALESVVPGIIALTSPEDQTRLDSPQVSLAWAADSSANSYEVLLQVSGATEVALNSSASSIDVSSFLDWGASASWSVRGVSGANRGPLSNTWSFSIIELLAPLLRAPEPGSVQPIDGVGFVWSAAPPATSYQLQVGTEPSFGSVVLNEAALPDTTFSASDFGNSTTYYWRVRSQNAQSVGDWSSVGQFETIDLAPGAPVPTYPEDGQQGVSEAERFEWQAGDNARVHRLVVSRDASFASLVLDSTVAATNLRASGLPNSTRLFWRVRAENTAGASAWSLPRELTTRVAIPAPPELLGPSSSSRQPQNPILAWQADTLAAENQVQVSRFSDFQTADLDSTTSQSLVRLSRLLADREYFWRVRSGNTSGWSPWSSADAFITFANELPVANTDRFMLDEDSSILAAVLGNDSDADGHTLVLDAVAPPAHGSASVAGNGLVLYEPLPDYFGPDSLQYSILDELGGWADGWMLLDVLPINDVPTPPRIITPGEGEEILVSGSPHDSLTVTWERSLDADADELVYQWRLSMAGADSLIYETGWVAGSEVSVAIGELAQALTRAGVGLAQSEALRHNVVAADNDTSAASSDVSSVFVRGEVTHVQEISSPRDFRLVSTYPNPTLGSVTIVIEAEAAGLVEFRVTDLLGRERRNGSLQLSEPGIFTIDLDLVQLSAGLYLITVSKNGRAFSSPMTLLR